MVRVKVSMHRLHTRMVVHPVDDQLLVCRQSYTQWNRRTHDSRRPVLLVVMPIGLQYSEVAPGGSRCVHRLGQSYPVCM